MTRTRDSDSRGTPSAMMGMSWPGQAGICTGIGWARGAGAGRHNLPSRLQSSPRPCRGRSISMAADARPAGLRPVTGLRRPLG